MYRFPLHTLTFVSFVLCSHGGQRSHPIPPRPLSGATTAGAKCLTSTLLRLRRRARERDRRNRRHRRGPLEHGGKLTQKNLFRESSLKRCREWVVSKALVLFLGSSSHWTTLLPGALRTRLIRGQSLGYENGAAAPSSEEHAPWVVSPEPERDLRPPSGERGRTREEPPRQLARSALRRAWRTQLLGLNPFSQLC